MSAYKSGFLQVLADRGFGLAEQLRDFGINTLDAPMSLARRDAKLSRHPGNAHPYAPQAGCFDPQAQVII